MVIEARGNISSVNWSLPSKGDFETLEANGVRKVINTTEKWFWSSSVRPNVSNDSYGFDGSYGVGDVNVGSVLCVGR